MSFGLLLDESRRSPSHWPKLVDLSPSSVSIRWVPCRIRLAARRDRARRAEASDRLPAGGQYARDDTSPLLAANLSPSPVRSAIRSRSALDLRSRIRRKSVRCPTRRLGWRNRTRTTKKSRNNRTLLTEHDQCRARSRAVTRHVSAWFGRDERPPTSGVSPIRREDRTHVRGWRFPVRTTVSRPWSRGGVERGVSILALSRLARSVRLWEKSRRVGADSYATRCRINQKYDNILSTIDRTVESVQ
jgi:hypothetical protein